jgi:hypothetical protein
MRRTGIIAGISGVVLVAGALSWSTLAVPQLVKFPINTNLTLHYTGHFLTYVNPSTGATLARPTSVPLSVDRRVQADPASSTSSVAIVKEQLLLHYSGKTATETNIYAVNRRSMCNVPSVRACTFAPGNPYPAAGSYYLTLPMNIKPGVTKMNMWKPETATTYPLIPLRPGAQPSSLDGLKVAWFNGILPMTPVAPYERTALAKEGLPMTLAPAQVEAQMTAAGISIPALTKALTPALTPAEASQVATVLTKPITLHYYAFGSGLVGAETRTGTEVDIKNVVDAIDVAPDTSGLHVLTTVLARHTSVAGVPAALAALRHLATAPPQPVYELQYSQTPASIAAMVSTTNSQLRQINIVTDWIPIGLAVLGACLLVTGIYRRRSRPTPPAAMGSTAGDFGSVASQLPGASQLPDAESHAA